MKTILQQIEELRGLEPDAKVSAAAEVATNMCWQDAWKPAKGDLLPFRVAKTGPFLLVYTDDKKQILIFTIRKNGDVVASLRPRPGMDITFRQDGQCEGFAPTKQHEPDKVPLRDWIPLVASYDIANETEQPTA